MSVLVSENVVKRFTEGRESVEVLKGVSLSVGRGEVVSLEGPSGSGKTTFLSILGCILTPTEGRVAIDGEAVDPKRPARLPEIRKKSIGFVFQQFNLFPALTALENVTLPAMIGGRKAEDRARELLSKVGLLRADSFVAAVPAGAATPVLKVKATFDESKTEEASLGRTGADAYGTRADEPGALKLSGSVLDDVLKALDAVVAPPTPAAPAAGTPATPKKPE